MITQGYLEHEGVIRYKGIRGDAMDEAVDTLLEKLNALP